MDESVDKKGRLLFSLKESCSNIQETFEAMQTDLTDRFGSCVVKHILPDVDWAIRSGYVEGPLGKLDEIHKYVCSKRDNRSNPFRKVDTVEYEPQRRLF